MTCTCLYDKTRTYALQIVSIRTVSEEQQRSGRMPTVQRQLKAHVR